MQKIIKKHKRKIITCHLVLVAFFTANLLDSLDSKKEVIMFLESGNGKNIIVAQNHTIDVNVSSETPINAVSATITFPEDRIEVVMICKKKSFLDLWTEEAITSTERGGRIHFSGGTFRRGGFVGTGTVLSLIFRAKEAGNAELRFEQAEVLAHDGRGTNVLNKTIDFTYFVYEEKTKSPPSPDVNKDGEVNIFDISDMSKTLFKDYDSDFDLNEDGKVNLYDFWSVLVSIF